MSTKPLTAPSNLLQDLLACWKKEFPKRASGGWWALSGFALQTSVYLLRFFQQLEKGVEPGLLAEMEHLSDILCPANGRLSLIQVKRTLTRHALISAVEEAYLITDLCRRETPALINHLQFQIACKERVTATQVADLSMPEVITSGGDVTSWNAMLACFDKLAPITEEPDALDHLYALLWNAGIRNTHALIERCVGKLLMNFGISDPRAMRQVGRELADFFFAAERYDKWDPVGKVLSAEDIMPDPSAAEYTAVLTGQQPRLDHLMKGFFRDRPEIFQALWETFTRWVSSLDPSTSALDNTVPVFWVSGRSGEGKSVLLIQLVAEALRSGIVSPLLHLKEGDDLPRLVNTAPDRAELSNRSFGRIFAVVDDVYDLHRHERDEWDATILSECDYRTPPVAVITCGPTEQKEQFAARLSGPFEVTSFEVPMLAVDECRAFLAWYESRTGKSREWNELTIENPLLVQLMFELAHGERIPEFARRFKKRLSDMKVFDAARAILAVNALYLNAPVGLLTTDEARDALEYMCKEEQLHFRVTTVGDQKEVEIRLAHPHLAWLLLLEWIESSPTSLAKAWARELHRSLIFFEATLNPLSNNLLFQLLHSARLSDEWAANALPPKANRNELIRELYWLHTNSNRGKPSPNTLPRWLELEYALPELRLTPDPAECAIALFNDPVAASNINGAAVIWLWLIVESTPEKAEPTLEAVKSFFIRYPANPGVMHSMEWLYIRKRDDPHVEQFVIDWLTTYFLDDRAYQLIVPVLAADPTELRRRKLALEWIATHESHPQTFWILAVLVASNPKDAELKNKALNWLVANAQHAEAYQVLAVLVAANPTDTEVVSGAIEWLDANVNHPRYYELLKVLIARMPTDSNLVNNSLNGLIAKEQRTPADEALITTHLNNAEVIERATEWLAVNENQHAAAHQVLATIIARSDGSMEWLERGVRYVSRPDSVHPEIIVGVLVTAGKAEPKYIEMAFDFMESTKTTVPRSSILYHLKRALVRNFHNAVQYLNGSYDEQRKKTVCASIALGMKRFPDTIAAFALDVVPRIDAEHVYHVLSNVITRELENDYLDEMIAQWLVDNYRRRGYGGLLDALHKSPAFWERIQSLGTLSRKIVEDFRRLE